MSGDWRDLAACRDYPPEMWFPDKADTASRDAALRVCRGCPVVTQCRAFAIDNTIPHGVFGGQTQKVRNKVLGIRADAAPVEDWQLDLKPCGTAAAYRRHQRRGEKPCVACMEGNAQYSRQRVR